MMRSMFAGVTGLRSHQTMMDVVGNNIANVNTPGFKSSQITFAETISQVLRGAAGSSLIGDRGGVNPAQIGLGVRVASIDGVFTQGSSQLTGRDTDVAIQGDGFFVVEAAGQRAYTRAGSFSFDEAGNLVSANGAIVQGWVIDAAGTLDPNRPIDDIRVSLGDVIDPIATTTVDFGGNLSADAAIGEVVSTVVVAYDSLGAAHEVQVDFTKTAVDTWQVDAAVSGAPFTMTPNTVTFDSLGQVASATTLSFSGFTPPGADPLAFDLDLAGDNQLSHFGGGTTAHAFSQNGQAIGFLSAFNLGDDGSVNALYSNGESQVVAMIATADFVNPSGLQRSGDSNFVATTNSGVAHVGQPGSGTRGLLSAGTLEMSNVDLAQEFTNLIIAQRGFQANSRVITASDEMLQELVNIKR